jgi:hypothetical protein
MSKKTFDKLVKRFKNAKTVKGKSSVWMDMTDTLAIDLNDSSRDKSIVQMMNLGLKELAVAQEKDQFFFASAILNVAAQEALSLKEPLIKKILHKTVKPVFEQNFELDATVKAWADIQGLVHDLPKKSKREDWNDVLQVIIPAVTPAINENLLDEDLDADYTKVIVYFAENSLSLNEDTKQCARNQLMLFIEEQQKMLKNEEMNADLLYSHSKMQSAFAEVMALNN